MQSEFINDNEQLKTYCKKIKDSAAIALDTEFVRERTFYPHLGLLQIFDGNYAALIDPLLITDWDCLLTIMTSKKIEKYFHSCSEDIDVFFHYFGLIPESIIDSQVLAAFLDNPISSGYSTLVKKYLNIELDKSETRTDWLKRPLSDKQCQYALNDVLYLLPLMDILKTKLVESNWLAAAYEECSMVISRKYTMVDTATVYLQIKNHVQLKGKQLGQLQKLAKWRYELAQQNDIALNFVIHEDLLLKIAKTGASSLNELEYLGMKGKQLRLYGNLVLHLLKLPTPTIPPIKRIVDAPNYKQHAANLKKIAQLIAQETGLNQELIISRRLINQYIKWYIDSDTDSAQPLPEILKTWRKPLFEKHLLL